MAETMLITPEEIRQQVEGRVVYSAERPIPFPAFLELSADRDVELVGGVMVEKMSAQLEHEKLFAWLDRVVGTYAHSTRYCRWIASTWVCSNIAPLSDTSTARTRCIAGLLTSPHRNYEAAPHNLGISRQQRRIQPAGDSCDDPIVHLWNGAVRVQIDYFVRKVGNKHVCSAAL